LALALSIALSAAPSFAQNTTSAIGGRISGADGKPAGGATVSILHVESGSVSSVTTDAEGRYVARGLRVGGPYTIIITKNGVTEKKEDIYVALAETSNVDATVGAPAIQTVTIAGNVARSEKFSRSSMGSGTSISPTELAIQASIQRNLQDFARADPRISQTDKDRGEMSVAGQNSRYNSLTIDGVAVNDTFGLEANGSPTARQPISIEAIQSVQVNVANYDVTQKGYTGANVNAVTKSGTNNWKGAGYYVYRDDRVVGDRYNNLNDTYFAAPPFEESTKGMWVSGPLIKDKLFFFALVEDHSSTRAAPSFGPSGSAKTNVPISQSTIDGAINIAKNKYGMNIGDLTIPEGTALSVREQMLKLDWNINDNHRAMVRYAKTDQAEPQFGNNSATQLTMNSQFYSQEKSIETLVGQWFADWTPSFSTEFKLSSRDYDSVPKNNITSPAISLRINGAVPAGTVGNTSTADRFLNFGTELSRHFNVLGTQTSDMYLGGNYSVGDHEIKFGTDYQKNKIFNAFLQNVNGTYTFNCTNSSASFTYTFGAINCTTATAAQIEAAVLENFNRGRPSNFTLQAPAPGVASIKDAAAQFSVLNKSAFVQDTWNVNDALTLTYGLRIDQTGVDGRPLTNTAAAMPMVAGNPTTGARQTGGFGRDNTVTPDGQKLVQPRFGFNYRFDKERAMQVRGGVGLFQGAAATVWLSNAFSNPGVATRILSCAPGAAACPSTDGFFSANVNGQPTAVAGAQPQANVDFLDGNLRQPSIWKSNIAFESELPWFGMVAGAEVLYAKNKDGIYYEHLNLGAPTRQGPDGREMFYNAAGFRTTSWTSAGGIVTGSGVLNKSLSNSAYNSVLLAKNTNKGDANIVTLSVSRPMIKGLGWSVAYTRSDATEASSLTSSVSSSSFNSRSVFNPNEDRATNSSYLVKDRINMLLNWQNKFFGNYNTRFGMFYEGRSGKPYSWTYNNDLNGDGLLGNDLMFIPKAPGSGEVSFFGATAADRTAAEEKFWAIVNGDKALKAAAGGVISRNTAFAPWTNSFDMKISQEIPGLFKGNKGTFAIDFLNVGNLFNKKWGRINEVAFQSQGGLARSFVDYGGIDAAG
ncbi:MAG: carboxypeptidase-like regulatory domain-containing protein, partial [Pseudomonadota bacterium]